MKPTNRDDVRREIESLLGGCIGAPELADAVLDVLHTDGVSWEDAVAHAGLLTEPEWNDVLNTAAGLLWGAK